MVQDIERYGYTLKVILKPTRLFPEGTNYFYTDVSASKIVESRSWCLSEGTGTYVVSSTGKGTILFHKEYAKYLELPDTRIGHRNLIAFDDRAVNLLALDKFGNTRNQLNKGYYYSNPDNVFIVQMTIDGRLTYFGRYTTEYEAIMKVIEVRDMYISDYDYDFLIDRRDDEDLLEAELTRKITRDEATYQHVMRYAKDNAWYYHRYGLQGYFNERGIKPPSYRLDSKGFMIHPKTYERLCPVKERDSV